MKKPQHLLLATALLLIPALSNAGAKVTPENDYRKGMDLYSKGRYEAALERFQLAIDGNWNFWQSYQMAGYCYFEMRNKEEALAAFEESLKINPRNPKLVKIVNNLRSGALDVPVRPVVEAEAQPVGTPVYLQTFYTYNR